MLDVVDFCSIGVDGFRLDAVPFLFEAEGTRCEGLPETQPFSNACVRGWMPMVAMCFCWVRPSSPSRRRPLSRGR